MAMMGMETDDDEGVADWSEALRLDNLDSDDGLDENEDTAAMAGPSEAGVQFCFVCLNHINVPV